MSLSWGFEAVASQIMSLRNNLATTGTEHVMFKSPRFRLYKIPPFGGYFIKRKRSKAPARFTWGFERRKHVALATVELGEKWDGGPFRKTLPTILEKIVTRCTEFVEFENTE